MPSPALLCPPRLEASPQPRIAGAHDSSLRTHPPIPVTAVLRRSRDLASVASYVRELPAFYFPDQRPGRCAFPAPQLPPQPEISGTEAFPSAR